MPTSKTSPYDVLIIGAGINGCCAAYRLRQSGLNVALVDQEGIAAGGSGAAGAFISPKISKSGPLKEIVEKAHVHALNFYTRRFPECVLRRPLLHIAKTPDDAEKVRAFKADTSLSLSAPDAGITDQFSCEVNDENSVFLTEGAVVNAGQVCRELAEGINFVREKVTALVWEEGIWRAGILRGAHVILAIGAYPKLLDLPYLNLRAIWGHRIDIRTTTKLPCILHHYVSISPTSQEGIMAIGATHDVHFSPFEGLPYDYGAGRAELIDKASKTLTLNNIEILRDYTGLRSGSNDYLPILGPLVDAAASLSSSDGYRYYPNLTIINGSGGYGFVLAPYLAEKLVDYLVEGKSIDPQLLPERFFRRWVKKNQS